MTIQRYGFWHDKNFKGEPGEFEPMPDGPYVLFTDHQALTQEEEMKTVFSAMFIAACLMLAYAIKERLGGK